MQGGGAERVASSLCNHWVKLGYEVMLVPTFSGRGDCLYALDQDVKLSYLADHLLSNQSFLPNKLRRFIQLRRMIKSNHPDVIISFLTSVNVVVILASIGLDKRVVISERNHPGLSKTLGFFRLMRRLIYRWASMVVVQTKENERWVRRNCFTSKVMTIPNPVEFPLRIGEPSIQPGFSIPEDRKIVLGVGRLTEQKGFCYLITAFAGLQQEFSEWDLVILGEGGLRRSLEDQSQKYHLEKRVHFPGRVGNLSDWYARAELYVLSSGFEGFPNTLLEAMAHGLPVISFDCDTGPRDIIQPDVSGLLVPLPAGVEGLTIALRKLMSNDGLRERMGNAALDVRQRFSMEAVNQKWSQALGFSN